MSDRLTCAHDHHGVCGECQQFFGDVTPEDHRASWHEQAAGWEVCRMYSATGCPLLIVPWSPTGQGGL